MFFFFSLVSSFIVALKCSGSTKQLGITSVHLSTAVCCQWCGVCIQIDVVCSLKYYELRNVFVIIFVKQDSLIC